jgi:hypothetical protein
MASIFQRVLNPTKQSFWRGVAAGLLCHYAALAVLLAILMLVRPLLWTALFGHPEWAEGPVDPGSGEGTVLQTLGALSWLFGGAAAIQWGGNRGVRAVLALLAYVAALYLVGMLSDTPPPMPIGRAAWYWLSAPLGICIGAVVSLKRRTRVASP